MHRAPNLKEHPQKQGYRETWPSLVPGHAAQASKVLILSSMCWDGNTFLFQCRARCLMLLKVHQVSLCLVVSDLLLGSGLQSRFSLVTYPELRIPIPEMDEVVLHARPEKTLKRAFSVTF